MGLADISRFDLNFPGFWRILAAASVFLIFFPFLVMLHLSIAEVEEVEFLDLFIAK
jgi:hypothetical protein